MNLNISKVVGSRLYLRRFFQIILAFLCLTPGKSFALEVYTLIRNGCEAKTGLIVNADDKDVYLLNLNGKADVIKREDIEVILVYNIHDNPIKSLDLNSGARDFLRETRVDDKENTRFIGWPIRFIENLIIFYDIEGKTHLVNIEKIRSLSSPGKTDLVLRKIPNFKPVGFGLGGNLPECESDKTGSKKYTEPTRMISDRIKISKFLSVYRGGFTALKRFQKKTAFYAKPFLYEKETRLALVLTKSDYLRELNLTAPFYFQWSSGVPYASQGQYSIGGKPSEILPSVEPQLTFSSDVKSHFFRASFAGNIMCLAAGGDCVIKNRMWFSDFFSKVDDDAHAVYPLFNYLALSGVDFHEYSISGGFYYPIYGISGNGIFREIHSDESSPIIKLERTTRDFNLKLIYSQTHISSNNPDDDKIQLIQTAELDDYASKSDTSKELIDKLEMFDLKTRFARIGFNYKIGEGVNIGFSEVVFQGKYLERHSEKDYTLDFLHYISSLSLKQDFSDYITIKSHINYFIRTYKYKLENEAGESNENKLSFALSIEFLL